MSNLPTNFPQFTIKQLLEAGVHFGHKTMRWNPKMEPFIFGERSDIHILDLQQTAPMLHSALLAIYEVARNNGRILFVGTKPQASDLVREAAEKSKQYYVNHRWLGGMLTNWNTVSQSIKTLSEQESMLKDDEITLNKKERLTIDRHREKLDRSLGGIRHMGRIPHLIFAIDTNREHLAIEEAQKLGIPTIAVVDSNSNPDGITYPIPGNDDAIRAIRLYCELAAAAAVAGRENAIAGADIDPGESAEGPTENLSDEDGKISVEVKGKSKKADKKADKDEAKAEEKAESKDEDADSEDGKKSSEAA